MSEHIRRHYHFLIIIFISKWWHNLPLSSSVSSSSSSPGLMTAEPSGKSISLIGLKGLFVGLFVGFKKSGSSGVVGLYIEMGNYDGYAHLIDVYNICAYRYIFAIYNALTFQW